jgi:hypothetical protein
VGFLEADMNGEGGYLKVSGGNSSYFTIDGDNFSTGEAVVTIGGSGSQTKFDVSASGDASVTLPNNAVSSAENLNEAGGAGAYAYDASTVALDAGQYEILASRSITVPSSGYVFAVASCRVWVSQSSGTTSQAIFGVSNTTSGFLPATDIMVQLSSALPSGSYILPFTSNAMVSVSAGTHTFYFLGREYNGTFNVSDVRLSLIFIPTAYGTVSSGTVAEEARDRAVESKPLSKADIEAERDESLRFNLERIQGELEAIRNELERTRADDNR